MAITDELLYSATPASNTTLGASITLDGTVMTPSQVDDAFRQQMAYRAAAITRHVTKAAGTYTAVKTDHNQFWRCTGAVTLNLTAAATLSDGWCLLVRANGGAVTFDPSGAELIDGAATLVIPDGMMALVICTGTTFFSWGALQNGITTGGNIKPSANGTYNLGVSGTAWLNLFLASGGVIDFNGGNYTLTHSAGVLAFSNTIKPSTHDGGALGVSGTAWSDIFLATGGIIDFGTSDVRFTHAAGVLSLVGGVFRIGQTTTDTPGAGNNTVGSALGNGGSANFSTAAGSGVLVNKTADSTLMTFASGGTAQGTISVAGATVTYGAFFGSHWSQLADGSRPDILRGTICESIDEMCGWPGEGGEDRLPRFKVSDVAGSKSVYGIFAWWDQDHDEDGNRIVSPTNDAFIGSLGAGWIRIAKGVTAQRGDYIESNGDGCGRVQADDILRSSTVGKVTSITVVETYPDGSYLVPCTLHCG